MDFPSKKAETLVVNPKGDHKQTFILLHGRGDRADSFGAGLLCMPLPDGESTLRLLFPTAKFVFLQAPLEELAAAPGTNFYQWFDVWDLRPGSEEADLQIAGLRATIEVVHTTLTREIDLVGAENVVLGGLSQGCASSLIALLLWGGPPIAACIGMSGWLPFRKLMEDTLKASSNDNTSLTELSPGQRPGTALGLKLGYADSFNAPFVFQWVPIFLGHGSDDWVVETRLGQEAARCLESMFGKVQFKQYEGLDHWYSPEMLQDLVQFLRGHTAWSK